MTDIEQKALALVNQVSFERVQHRYTSLARAGDAKVEALCRALEQHEAFKQEVSDALEEYKADQPYVWKRSASDYFCRFIINADKPDPLVEVLDDMEWRNNSDEWAADLRAALEARGLEIRSKNDDQ
jgi:hypothetical protein